MIREYSNTTKLVRQLLDRGVKRKALIARRFFGKPIITQLELNRLSGMLESLEDCGFIESIWVSLTEHKGEWCYRATQLGRENLPT